MNTKLTATDASFDKAYEAHNQAEMVEFFASWCPHCKRMEPTVNRLAKEYDGKANVLAVDVDEAPMASRKFGISGVPTFLFVKNGKVMESISGEQSENDLRQKMDNLRGCF